MVPLSKGNKGTMDESTVSGGYTSLVFPPWVKPKDNQLAASLIV